MTKQQALELYEKISKDSRFSFIVNNVRITHFIFWSTHENYDQSIKKQALLDYTTASTILLLPDTNNIRLTLFSHIHDNLPLCPTEPFESFLNRKALSSEFAEYL